MVNEEWLLVAPWGDPAQWECARYKPYVFRGKPRKVSEYTVYGDPGEGVLATTSLVAVAEAYVENGIGIHEALVVAADTLAGGSVWMPLSRWEKKLRCEENSACRDICYRRRSFVEKYRERYGGEEIRGYGDIVRRARDYVELYLRELGIEKRLGELGVEVNVDVAPGTGVYKIDPPGVITEFRQHAGNFYNHLYSLLAEKLVETGAAGIILDITHGVNYMPALALEASRNALAYAAIESGEEKHLVVLNSDPYSRAARPGQELYVHIVLAEEYRSSEAAAAAIARAGAVGEKLRIYSIADTKAGKRLSDMVESLFTGAAGLRLSEVMRGFQSISLAIQYNSVLYLANYMYYEEKRLPRRDAAERYLDAIRELISRARRFTRRDNRIIIEGRITLNTDTTIYHHVLALYHALYTAINHGSIVFKLVTVNGEKTPVFPLSSLEVAAKKFPLSIIAKREINDIVRRTKTYIEKHSEALEKPLCYKEIYEWFDWFTKHRESKDEPWKERKCNIDGVDTRNFLAHAGFEKNITVIYVDKDFSKGDSKKHIWAGYIGEKAYRKAKEKLGEAIKET